MKEFIEKLIERLEEKRKSYFKTFFEYGLNTDLGREDGLKESIEIVKELTEEHNGGWIPCSERLPNENERVLVTYEDKHIGCGTLDVCDGMYIQVFGGIWSISAYSNDECFNVIAWQPLPQKYEPKGE